MQQVATALPDLAPLVAPPPPSVAGLAEPVLSAIMTWAPFGLAVLDRDLGVVALSERFAHLTGASAGAEHGRPLGELLPALDRDAIERVHAVARHGQAVHGDRWGAVEISLLPLHTAGQHAAVVGVAVVAG